MPEATKKGVRFCVYGSDWVGPDQRFWRDPVSLTAAFESWMQDLSVI